MEDFYAHIDDYKNGLLSSEEHTLFQSEMNTNASLKKAVENYDSAKAISEGLLELEMVETLKRLKDSDIYHVLKGDQQPIRTKLLVQTSQKIPTTFLKPKMDSKSKLKNKKIKISSWLVAASMIGVIAFSAWWLEINETESKYFAFVQENFEWPEDLDGNKSADTLGMTDFEKGKYYFGLRRFEKSLVYLEKHISQETDSNLLSEGYEWLGAVYLKIGKIDKAKSVLMKSKEEKVIRNLKLFE